MFGKSFTQNALSIRSSSHCVLDLRIEPIRSDGPRLPWAAGNSAATPSRGPAPSQPQTQSGQGLRLHLGAIARARRDPVPPAIDHDEIQKVLVKVIDELDHPALELAARADIVEDRQVMDQLT